MGKTGAFPMTFPQRPTHYRWDLSGWHKFLLSVERYRRAGIGAVPSPATFVALTGSQRDKSATWEEFRAT